MGLLSRVERRASIENPSTSLSSPDQWLVDAFGGGPTNAGVSVSQDSALKLSVVYACVNVLSQDVAKLPLITYRHLTPGKERAPEHPVYPLLKRKANFQSTAFNFRRTLQAHAMTWGGGFAEIELNNDDEPIGLWPLLPDRTEVLRVDGQKIFKTTVGNDDVFLRADQVLYIPGLGFDGLRGYSVINYAKQAIGAGLAAEQFGAEFFGNGARPGGVITRKDSLTEEAQDRIRRSWDTKHQGLSNAQRVAILDEGMDYKMIGVPPEDAQFIASKQFSVEDVVRFFRVPPHKVQHLLRSTFSNIQDENRSYVADTLQAWLVNWEQEVNITLFDEDEQDEFFAEHNVEALLRGNSEDRAAFYQSGINNGWMNPNQVRAKENMNPYEGGERYYISQNVIPVEQAGMNMARTSRQQPVDTEERTAQEKRATASATERHRVQKAHVRAFASVADRLIIRETESVRGIVTKVYGERNAEEFGNDLIRFYENFLEIVRAAFTPLLTTYADTIKSIIAEELGRDISPDPTFEQFTEEYINGFSVRYVRKSRKQLDAIVNEVPIEQQADAVLERLDQWENGNPDGSGTPRRDKLADNESVRAMGALSKAAYAAASVLTLRWVTFGTNCPFCNKLDGKIIGIQENFMDKGDILDPDIEDEEPMTVRAHVGHPPLHNFCNCGVSPGGF